MASSFQISAPVMRPVVAGALLLGMVTWLALSLRLALFTDNGQPGPGYWPTVLSTLGIVTAGVVTFRAVRESRTAATEAPEPDQAETTHDERAEEMVGEGGVYEDRGLGAHHS